MADRSPANTETRRTSATRRTPRTKLSPRHFRGYLFLLPCLLVYGGFLVWPLFYNLYISFTEWNGLTPNKKFVGLANYVKFLFDDDTARTALLNNLLWTVATVLVPTLLGLILATALNARIRARVLFRSIFYAPGVLPLVGVALIWGWLYNPNFGFINELLRGLGFDDLTRSWLGDPSIAMYAVIVAGIWVRTGVPMLLYLAGMQAIPTERYESARVDGASAWQTFRNVTLPGLRETHVVVIALTLIDALKVFDLIYGLTYGGPGNSTQVLGTWMYFNSFQYYNAGYGGALAVIIAVLSIAFVIPYIMILRRRAD